MPGLKTTVGDAEYLGYATDTFDGVYCFRSSWYFPDLGQAIREMIRVAGTGGLVMFDIRNASHSTSKALVERFGRRTKGPVLFRVALRYLRNLGKLALRPIRWYPCDWSVHEVDSTVSCIRCKKRTEPTA